MEFNSKLSVGQLAHLISPYTNKITSMKVEGFKVDVGVFSSGNNDGPVWVSERDSRDTSDEDAKKVQVRISYRLKSYPAGAYVNEEFVHASKEELLASL